jgi:hypothetical protein
MIRPLEFLEVWDCGTPGLQGVEACVVLPSGERVASHRALELRGKLGVYAARMQVSSEYIGRQMSLEWRSPTMGTMHTFPFTLTGDSVPQEVLDVECAGEPEE